MTPDDIQKAYDDVYRFVRYLASCNSDDNNVMMQANEIEGELWVEFVKAIRRYSHLPYEQLLAVIRRMMDNRVAELRYRHYVTHRKKENGIRDVDDLVEEPYSGVCPEDAAISSERIAQIQRRLSATAREVFIAVIYGDERVTDQCRLAGWRRAFVYKGGGHVRLTPNILANALAKEIDEIRESLAEIEMVVRKYGQ